MEIPIKMDGYFRKHPFLPGPCHVFQQHISGTSARLLGRYRRKEGGTSTFDEG